MNFTPIATFTVCGLPKGQPRPRAFARYIGGKAVARVYDAGTAECWKGDIARQAMAHKPPKKIEGPVRVEIEFLFARPKYLQQKKYPRGEIPHTAKPDCDNASKVVLDALTVLGFWGDDAQVFSCLAEKYYIAIDGQPGARVRISVPAVEQPSLLNGDNAKEIYVGA